MAWYTLLLRGTISPCPWLGMSDSHVSNLSFPTLPVSRLLFPQWVESAYVAEGVCVICTPYLWVPPRNHLLIAVKTAISQNGAAKHLLHCKQLLCALWSHHVWVPDWNLAEEYESCPSHRALPEGLHFSQLVKNFWPPWRTCCGVQEPLRISFLLDFLRTFLLWITTIFYLICLLILIPYPAGVLLVSHPEPPFWCKVLCH